MKRLQRSFPLWVEGGVTLGVAESLTGGALCAELVSVAGASAVLRGGVVAYATPIKKTVLGVDPALLAGPRRWPTACGEW